MLADDEDRPFARVLGWDHGDDPLLPIVLDFEFVDPIDTDEMLAGVSLGMTRMQARQLAAELLALATE